jgi:hypothetical protein
MKGFGARECHKETTKKKKRKIQLKYPLSFPFNVKKKRINHEVGTIISLTFFWESLTLSKVKRSKTPTSVSYLNVFFSNVEL